MRGFAIMKNNRLNLVISLLDLTAGVCFSFSAALQTQVLVKALNGIAAAGLLLGGVGFFFAYVKSKKR